MDSETPSTIQMDSEFPLMGSLNPSAVLEFSKFYKFIVKFAFFHYRSDTTKNDLINDQLLCGHFQFKYYLVTKLVIYLCHFYFSSYPMTKLIIYLGHFQLAHLKFLNFGHLPLEKTNCDQIFWSPSNLSLILY